MPPVALSAMRWSQMDFGTPSQLRRLIERMGSSSWPRLRSLPIVRRQPDRLPASCFSSLCKAGFMSSAVTSRNRNRRLRFFSRAAEFGAALNNAPFLVVGDLNTGRNDVDRSERGVKFALEDEFISLSRTTGLVDLWRQEHGERALEWTWLTAKNGFRIDHAFGNQALLGRFSVVGCRYDHSPRNFGLSDHSAMVLDLAPK